MRIEQPESFQGARNESSNDGKYIAAVTAKSFLIELETVWDNMRLLCIFYRTNAQETNKSDRAARQCQ